MSRPRLASGMVAATALLLAIGVAAAIATPGGPATEGWSGLAFVVPVAIFSAVGGVIARRRPENVVGWLLLTIGLLFAVVVASSLASKWALESETLSKPVGEWIDVPGSVWVFGLGLIGTQLPMRLPDGRLPSAHWRRFSRVTLFLIAMSFVGMAATPGRVEGVAGTVNPLASDALKPLAAVFLLVVASFVGGLAALVVRYRRSGAHERVQLRWVAFGGIVFLAVYLVTLLLDGLVDADSTADVAITVISQLAFAAVPLSIGYAVLRHRLYDIDTVVNRALVYGVLTASLAAAYLGSVLVLQLALSGVTGGSGLAVAAATLAAAALFRPARARIQDGVYRRFYRRKYDAQRTLAEFSGRLRDEVALDSLVAELIGVVAQTMQPARVSVWLPEPRAKVSRGVGVRSRREPRNVVGTWGP